jgi:hypothetical protein
MPSYKDKFETITRNMADIEQRVLIDSGILRSLRNEIENLKAQQSVVPRMESTEPKIDPFVKTQLSVALGEVEELLFGERVSNSALVELSSKDILETTVASLHKMAQLLRDSRTRAETILEGLDVVPRGKLLKRERREQMRKESISSLAASLAQSPQRDPMVAGLQSPPRFLSDDGSRNSSPRGRRQGN